MTREEAVENLKIIREHTLAGNWYEEEALDLAISELERSYGQWIINGIGYSETYSYKLNCSCSVCGYESVFYDTESSTNPCLEKANYVHKYCPHCGAYMVEPQESEERAK